LTIGGFFSAKLASNQIDWLPCEREALAIGSSVQYFQPYIRGAFNSVRRTNKEGRFFPCSFDISFDEIFQNF